MYCIELCQPVFFLKKNLEFCVELYNIFDMRFQRYTIHLYNINIVGILNYIYFAFFLLYSIHYNIIWLT